MAQLIENKPRPRALIATLLHFDDPTRVVVLSDQRESKDLFWFRRAHRLTFLIDRGYQLEVDLTNSESACLRFLIVAESRFSNFANTRAKQALEDLARRPLRVAGEQSVDEADFVDEKKAEGDADHA